MRDDRLRLADTLEAIGQIEKYSQRGRAAFDENELIRVWIFHHLQIIGEACRTTFGKRIRTRCGPTLWAFGMSWCINTFGIDLDAVWEVVVRDLPELKSKVLEIAQTPPSAEEN